jgi:transcriptional antiterminator NusG
MHYYAIQVQTGDEDKFIRRADIILKIGPQPEVSLNFFAPKRTLKEKKAGKQVSILRHVFPGYVFLETETLETESRWKIRRLRGFYRFLPDSVSPLPLVERDKSLLLRFISFGKSADISKVTFDENQRIVVLEGPLRGLEGSIVKVDKRRGRAKVKLDMCEVGFLIDLGFEVVAGVTKGGDSTNGEHGS